MDIDDAARVILRSGIRRLPVVDEDGMLVGIISNADVIRSQIERATPGKVDKLMRTLQEIHSIGLSKDRRDVRLTRLTPTQDTVYADELEGRRYELERGLAEPLVVIDNGGDLYLADGHHRVKAADRLGVDCMDAYVIALDEPVDLGMAKTARKEGLASIADINVVDYAHHPLVEKTRLPES
jgi:CBS domain-containing protein